MSAEIDQHVRELLRDFMSRKGRPVKFEEPRYEGDDGISPYGWVGYNADLHGKTLSEDPETRQKWIAAGYAGCGWVVPEGAVLTEETYSMFDGTGNGNDDEVGINVSGCHCTCGRYSDVTLRFQGSFGEVLADLLGQKPYKLSVTL